MKHTILCIKELDICFIDFVIDDWKEIIIGDDLYDEFKLQVLKINKY